MTNFRKNILIADNNTLLLDVLCLALANVEFQVITADSLAEAERAVANLSFDLVVTELHFNRGSKAEGFDLLAAVTQKCPDTRVIVMTARGTPELEREAYERGAYLFLNKPFNLRLLEVQLEKLGFS